jgi:uncharacterized membrane protein YuzA (DUF378 family)
MRTWEGMKVWDIFATALLVIGGLNWGLVGFFDYNLLATIFGEASAICRVIYAFVGVSALYEAFSFSFGFKAVQHRWCEPATAKH